MRKATHRTAALAVALALAACNALFGDFEKVDALPDGGDTDADTDSDADADADADGDADGDTDADADTDTDTEVDCPTGTHACVDAPTGGWNGPAAVHVGDASSTPPTCGGDYPTEATALYADLEVPDSSCLCDCGSAAGATCAGTADLGYYASDSSCASLSQTKTIGTTCSSFGGEFFANRYWRLDTSDLTISGGSCPPVSDATILDAFFLTALIGCGGAVEGGNCSGTDLCMPIPDEPFAAALCVWKAGDTPCPAGSEYDQRTVYYTSFEDSRECAECTCDAPTGSCATSYASMNSAATCDGTYAGSVTTSCTLIGLAASQAATVVPVVTGASCAPSAGSLTGAVTGEYPFTVCCMAE